MDETFEKGIAEDESSHKTSLGKHFLSYRLFRLSIQDIIPYTYEYTSATPTAASLPFALLAMSLNDATDC